MCVRVMDTAGRDAEVCWPVPKPGQFGNSYRLVLGFLFCFVCFFRPSSPCFISDPYVCALLFQQQQPVQGKGKY